MVVLCLMLLVVGLVVARIANLRGIGALIGLLSAGVHETISSGTMDLDLAGNGGLLECLRKAICV